jgi:hypothetical protein
VKISLYLFAWRGRCTTANGRDGVEVVSGRRRGGRRRSWAARGQRAGGAGERAQGRGRRVAGGEGGRGVGGEGGRVQRVSVSEREKKEKPSDWLSLCSLPSVVLCRVSSTR